MDMNPLSPELEAPEQPSVTIENILGEFFTEHLGPRLDPAQNQNEETNPGDVYNALMGLYKTVLQPQLEENMAQLANTSWRSLATALRRRASADNPPSRDNPPTSFPQFLQKLRDDFQNQAINLTVVLDFIRFQREVLKITEAEDYKSLGYYFKHCIEHDIDIADKHARIEIEKLKLHPSQLFVAKNNATPPAYALIPSFFDFLFNTYQYNYDEFCYLLRSMGEYDLRKSFRPADADAVFVALCAINDGEFFRNLDPQILLNICRNYHKVASTVVRYMYEGNQIQELQGIFTNLYSSLEAPARASFILLAIDGIDSKRAHQYFKRNEEARAEHELHPLITKLLELVDDINNTQNLDETQRQEIFRCHALAPTWFWLLREIPTQELVIMLEEAAKLHNLVTKHTLMERYLAKPPSGLMPNLPSLINKFFFDCKDSKNHKPYTDFVEYYFRCKSLRTLNAQGSTEDYLNGVISRSQLDKKLRATRQPTSLLDFRVTANISFEKFVTMLTSLPPDHPMVMDIGSANRFFQLMDQRMKRQTCDSQMLKREFKRIIVHHGENHAVMFYIFTNPNYRKYFDRVALRLLFSKQCRFPGGRDVSLKTHLAKTLDVDLLETDDIAYILLNNDKLPEVVLGILFSVMKRKNVSFADFSDRLTAVFNRFKDTSVSVHEYYQHRNRWNEDNLKNARARGILFYYANTKGEIGQLNRSAGIDDWINLFACYKGDGIAYDDQDIVELSADARVTGDFHTHDISKIFFNKPEQLLRVALNIIGNVELTYIDNALAEITSERETELEKQQASKLAIEAEAIEKNNNAATAEPIQGNNTPVPTEDNIQPLSPAEMAEQERDRARAAMLLAKYRYWYDAASSRLTSLANYSAQRRRLDANALAHKSDVIKPYDLFQMFAHPLVAADRKGTVFNNTNLLLLLSDRNIRNTLRSDQGQTLERIFIQQSRQSGDIAYRLVNLMTRQNIVNIFMENPEQLEFVKHAMVSKLDFYTLHVQVANYVARYRQGDVETEKFTAKVKRRLEAIYRKQLQIQSQYSHAAGAATFAFYFACVIIPVIGWVIGLIFALQSGKGIYRGLRDDWYGRITTRTITPDGYALLKEKTRLPEQPEAIDTPRTVAQKALVLQSKHHGVKRFHGADENTLFMTVEQAKTYDAKQAIFEHAKQRQASDEHRVIADGDVTLSRGEHEFLTGHVQGLISKTAPLYPKLQLRTAAVGTQELEEDDNTLGGGQGLSVTPTLVTVEG